MSSNISILLKHHLILDFDILFLYSLYLLFALIQISTAAIWLLCFNVAFVKPVLDLESIIIVLLEWRESIDFA